MMLESSPDSGIVAAQCPFFFFLSHCGDPFKQPNPCVRIFDDASVFSNSLPLFSFFFLPFFLRKEAPAIFHLGTEGLPHRPPPKSPRTPRVFLSGMGFLPFFILGTEGLPHRPPPKSPRTPRVFLEWNWVPAIFHFGNRGLPQKDPAQKPQNQTARLRCSSKSLRVRRALQLLSHRRDIGVQAQYHIAVGVDGGAWLGQAYPRPPPWPD